MTRPETIRTPGMKTRGRKLSAARQLVVARAPPCRVAGLMPFIDRHFPSSVIYVFKKGMCGNRGGGRPCSVSHLFLEQRLAEPPAMETKRREHTKQVEFTNTRRQDKSTAEWRVLCECFACLPVCCRAALTPSILAPCTAASPWPISIHFHSPLCAAKSRVSGESPTARRQLGEPEQL